MTSRATKSVSGSPILQHQRLTNESLESVTSIASSDVLQTVHTSDMDAIAEFSSLRDSEQTTVRKHYELHKIKKDARKTPKSRKGGPSKHWNFLQKNADLLQHDVFRCESLEALQNTGTKYLHYSEVPALPELFVMIRERNRLKASILRKRRSASSMERQRGTALADTVRKTQRSHQLKMARIHGLTQRGKKVEELVVILRSDPPMRTEAALNSLKDWLLSTTRKDSIISTFLRDCDDEEDIFEVRPAEGSHFRYHSSSTASWYLYTD